MRELIAQGEGSTVEFKRCGNKPERDIFETICSFANREGGNILLGVHDDATIAGVNPREAVSIQRNIANVVSNPNCFNTAPLVESERIDIDDKVVVRVWVPMGPSVYRYRGKAYDRVFDSDVPIKSDDQIATLYLRKKNLYTERKVYPYVRPEDLRADLLDRMRDMIRAHRVDHPWLLLDDASFFRAARLYTKDEETGAEGFNLACVMLLGTDELISNVVPVYRTDALYKGNGAARYDDRLTVATNLLESHDELTAFAEKWLPDPFYLEGRQRKSIRAVIVRELVGNCLMHREFTSPFLAKLVIDGEGISTRNASRAIYSVSITPDNLNPTPKNPIIANIFTQVGLAEALGSGTQYLFEYSKLYSSADPVLRDGDFFEAFVPVPRAQGDGAAKNLSDKGGKGRDMVSATAIALAEEKGVVTSSALVEATSVSAATARRKLNALASAGVFEKFGNTKGVSYRLRQ